MLFDGVIYMLRNASDDTAVWLDFVAVNQHNDTRPAINQVCARSRPGTAPNVSHSHGRVVARIDVSGGC
jgi:hypothetical protein